MSEPPIPLSPRRDARVALFEGFGVVYSWGLRRGFASRRFRWAAGLTVGLGVLLGLVVSRHPDPASHLWLRLDDSIFAVAVPLIALALAGSGYAEEIAEQTLVYHLVRPVSRATVFLARFAAGVLPCVVGAAGMALAVALGSGVRLGVLTYAAIAATAAVGAASVGAVYFALGAVYRRGLIAGLIYTFVVEGVFQVMPGSVQDLSLMHHVRSLFHRWADADFKSVSTSIRDALEHRTIPIHGRPGVNMLLRRATEEWTTTSNALWVAGAVLAAALAIGAIAVKRKDFALKE